MRRDLLWLTAVALVLRLVAAWLVEFPPYTDPAYYLVVAQQLAHGQGFTTPVLWSFLEVGGQLPADPTLPVAAFGHWMPMTSLVAAAGIWAFEGVLGTWRAAQLPFVLLSTALVPFTYLVSRELYPSRSVAVAASVLALLAGPFLVYYPQVNNIALFGALGAGALWCAMRAVRTERAERAGWWLVGSGALAGAATLTRVDGLLLLVPLVVGWWLARQRVAGGWLPVAWLVAAAGAFVLVLAPWLVRNLSEFGAAFPSAGGHTLWITSYNQQFSISADPSPGSYLEWGAVNIIGSKLAAWGELLGRVAVLLGGLFILTFAWGLWVERRRRELAPFLAYFAAVFVAMGLVFTFHAPKGAFYHSAGAWLPFAIPLAVASLPGLASALGRWWPFLRRPQTHRFLLVAGLAGALVLSVAGSASVLAQWWSAHGRLAEAAGYLRGAAAPADRVMAYDPAALHFEVPLEGVAPPFDPFPVIGQVVDAYDIRWVVVTLPAGESRDPLGLWDGAQALDSAGNHPDFLPADPAYEAPGVRVYRVTPR
jgi:4-amino-4-deoxy-L-arabinose transferase-like glycosyltransferase